LGEVFKVFWEDAQGWLRRIITMLRSSLFFNGLRVRLRRSF